MIKTLSSPTLSLRWPSGGTTMAVPELTKILEKDEAFQ